jgi:hypothetical protein
MRKKMGEVGRKRTTTYFDIHTMVKQYRDVYEKAMK